MLVFCELGFTIAAGGQEGGSECLLKMSVKDLVVLFGIMPWVCRGQIHDLFMVQEPRMEKGMVDKSGAGLGGNLYRWTDGKRGRCMLGVAKSHLMREISLYATSITISESSTILVPYRPTVQRDLLEYFPSSFIDQIRCHAPTTFLGFCVAAHIVPSRPFDALFPV